MRHVNDYPQPLHLTNQPSAEVAQSAPAFFIFPEYPAQNFSLFGRAAVFKRIIPEPGYDGGKQHRLPVGNQNGRCIRRRLFKKLEKGVS